MKAIFAIKSKLEQQKKRLERVTKQGQGTPEQKHSLYLINQYLNHGNTTTTDERQMDVENIYLFMEQYSRLGGLSPLQDVPHWIDYADVQDSN